MTTCLFDRRTMEVGADTQNTTPSGGIVRVHKIEKLKNGWWFLGSGHCLGISLARDFAMSGWTKRPDFSNLSEDEGSDCLVIDAINNRVWLFDDELTPNLISDVIVGVGSGAAYGIGAMAAGATIEQALIIAAEFDSATSAPFEVMKIV